MEQSMYIKYIKKNFQAIALGIIDKLNDSKNPMPYLHRQMLKKDFSVSGKWESLSIANTMVMADVVAMDSSLPLKKRDSITKADGKIPKMGMELKLNEQQLTDIDTLIAQGGTENQILAKLFADTPKVIGGIYERCEAIFLEGLSTGVTVIEDSENVGTGVRLDYNYGDDHKFGVATVWSSTSSKPFDDIEKVLTQASGDGNRPTVVLIEKSAFTNLAKTDQAKELFAFNSGITTTDSSRIPVPSLSQLNTFTSDRYGFVFQIVDRGVRYEKNGIQTTVKPFAAGAVVFLNSLQVGSLVYARLAEQNHPVSGVSYQTVDDFILASMYRMNRPSMSEYTSSQARVAPVISNVDSIYLLDSTTVQA